ncbi:MAG: hypothetical protein HZB85_03705 [Deltaproteobacteria bacterium]|nr:hypothetical protein [Deltaproteobacteria bacterium]
MKKSLPLFLYICVLAGLGSLAACSAGQDQDVAVATVNDAPILLKDLREELLKSSERKSDGEFTRSELEARLGIMIDRKLMVQEAVNLGLANDERFLKTIKSFWEQTLIRELVAVKTKQWSETLAVSDGEISALYARMRYKVYVKEAHTPDPRVAEAILGRMRANGRVEGMTRRGPLFAERVGMYDPLYNVFDMKTGQAAIWPEPGGYLIVMVTGKTRLALPPFKSVRAETKRYIFEKKKEHAIDEWLDGLKTASRVKVNAPELGKIKRVE